jgi:hypothetical protein
MFKNQGIVIGVFGIFEVAFLFAGRNATSQADRAR